jgi:hypothetical protein
MAVIRSFIRQPLPPHLSTATFHLFICQPSLYASVHGNHPLSTVSIPSAHLSTAAIRSVNQTFYRRICPQQPSIYSSVSLLYTHLSMAIIHFE